MNSMRSCRYIICFSDIASIPMEHEDLFNIFKNIYGISYACMSDELGSNGKLYTLAYIHTRVPVAEEWMKKMFKGPHVQRIRLVGFDGPRSYTDYVRRNGMSGTFKEREYPVYDWMKPEEEEV